MISLKKLLLRASLKLEKSIQSFFLSIKYFCNFMLMFKSLCLLEIRLIFLTKFTCFGEKKHFPIDLKLKKWIFVLILLYWFIIFKLFLKFFLKHLCFSIMIPISSLIFFNKEYIKIIRMWMSFWSNKDHENVFFAYKINLFMNLFYR